MKLVDMLEVWRGDNIVVWWSRGAGWVNALQAGDEPDDDERRGPLTVLMSDDEIEQQVRY